MNRFRQKLDARKPRKPQAQPQAKRPKGPPIEELIQYVDDFGPNTHPYFGSAAASLQSQAANGIPNF